MIGGELLPTGESRTGFLNPEEQDTENVNFPRVIETLFLVAMNMGIIEPSPLTTC